MSDRWPTSPDDLWTKEERDEAKGRYVGLRCPICGDRSPTVDQQTDVHRNAMNEWWRNHHRVHVPYPIIEVRPPIEDGAT